MNQPPHCAQVSIGYKRHSHTFAAHTTRATRPMCICLIGLREIVIDDVRYFVEIKPPGGYIRRHQKIDLLTLELPKHRASLRLV